MLPPLPAGGLLIGIGADICDVGRIRDVNTRQGRLFLERVYTQEELDYCGGFADPHPSLAARFAAKEAVAKAFGTGVGADFGWKTSWVTRDERGRPTVTLDEQGRDLLRRVGGTHILLTLSHTDTTALAVAAIVRLP